MFRRPALLAVCILAATALPARAQAPAPDAAASACASLWPPCGPDRMLDEAELRKHLARSGEATRIEFTGGRSGRPFLMVLKPEGRLDMSMNNGANFGRDWKLEGNKLCLRLYQNIWQGQFNCGEMEVKGGKLYWLDRIDGSSNPISAVSHVKS